MNTPRDQIIRLLKHVDATGALNTNAYTVLERSDLKDALDALTDEVMEKKYPAYKRVRDEFSARSSVHNIVANVTGLNDDDGD